MTRSSSSTESTVPAAASLLDFFKVLLDPSLSRRILRPDFLSMIYGLLIVFMAFCGVYSLILAFQYSLIWGVLALIFLPIAGLTCLVILRVLFELVSMFYELTADIKSIAAMQNSIDTIATMAKPVADIGGSVSEMSTDIKTIAQMYSSIHKISSLTENIDTIANMYADVHKIASMTDYIADISEMKDAVNSIFELTNYIETIAEMRPSIDKIATLTDHIEIIADMRDSIDKISEIGDMVSKLRRAPFMRS